MGFAKYQIHFLEPSGDSTILFLEQSAPYRLKYEHILNSVSACTIEIPFTGIDYFDELPVDTIIMIQRILDGSVAVQNDAFFLLRSMTRMRVGEDERWVIGGLSLNHLLSRRIVLPEDDPIASGGYVTRAGAADTVIYNYVRYQCTSDVQVNAIRAIPDLVASAPSGIGNNIGRRLRHENLLKVVKDMAKTGNVDFEITRDLDGVGGMTFTVGRIGQDKSVATNGVLGPYTVLSPDLGNLQSPQYTIDRGKEETIAFAIGDGDNTNRNVITLSSGRENDSIYNRIETLVEVRSADSGSTQEILTGGLNALLDKKPKRELKFDIIPGAVGARYKQDLNLGDIVTIVWGSVEQSVRIQKITISLSASGEEIEYEVNDEDLS